MGRFNGESNRCASVATEVGDGGVMDELSDGIGWKGGVGVVEVTYLARIGRRGEREKLGSERHAHERHSEHRKRSKALTGD